MSIYVALKIFFVLQIMATGKIRFQEKNVACNKLYVHNNIIIYNALALILPVSNFPRHQRHHSNANALGGMIRLLLVA